MGYHVYMRTDIKKYFNEFIGTFFLVLTVVLTVNNPNVGNFAPFAIGAVLAGMVYAGYHRSGAYYNPALTLAKLMRGETDKHDAFYYTLAQLLAGFLAALIGVYLLGCQGITDINARSGQATCAIVGELLGTFVLTYVTLTTVAGSNNQAHAFGGLTVGLVYMAMVYAMGGLSGGAFNPAVALGFAIAGMVSWGDLWTYFLGSLLGAAAAVSIIQAMAEKSES